MTFAKGISNGAAAIGAMVTTEEIGERAAASAKLISTFGWTPVACAAAAKTLEMHQRDHVWEKAEQDGTYLLKTLHEELKDVSALRDIRGKGMEIGLVFGDDDNPSWDPSSTRMIVENARAKGLYLTGGGSGILQIMPPLTIDRKDLDHGIAILVDVILSSGHSI